MQQALGSSPTDTFTSVDPPYPCAAPCAMNKRSVLRDKAGVLCTLPLRLARRDHKVQMATAGLGVCTFSDERESDDRGSDQVSQGILATVHPILITFMQCLHPVTVGSRCPPDSQQSGLEAGVHPLLSDVVNPEITILTPQAVEFSHIQFITTVKPSK